MAVYCRYCGKENKNENVVCEFCGNMLRDIFSPSDVNQNNQNLNYQGTNVQPQNVQPQGIAKTNQPVQQTDVSMSNLNDYFFKIDSLIGIDEFVKMAKDIRENEKLSKSDKDEILKKLRKRACDVFGDEIEYYDEKGTIMGNLKNTCIWFIVGIILSGIFAPLGIICYIVMFYYLCKTVARVFTLKKSTHAAKVVKKLKKCGLH